MKYLLVIVYVLFSVACSNKPQNSRITQSKTDDSTTQNTDENKIDTIDRSKAVIFLDTTFNDQSHLIISSFWLKNEIGFYYLDPIRLNITVNNKEHVLVYNDIGAADAIVIQIDRRTDKKENLYCFIKFHGSVSPSSEIIIAYMESKKGISKVTFDKNDGLNIIDCGIKSIGAEEIIKSCSARPSTGRNNDELEYYTRNTDTSFVLNKTEIVK